MRQKVQQQTFQSKENTETSQYIESAILHRGQKYISTKTDPQFAVAFSIPQQDVVELFEQIAKQMGFELIQSEQTYATAIKKPPKAGFLQLLNCFNWWGPNNQINAVKLTILNSPKSTDTTLKLCRIRALSQPTIQVIAFVQAFKDKMEKIKGVIPSAYLFQPSSYSQQPSFQNNSNPFHLQACAFYMFHKILISSSGSEYKVKQNMEKSLKDFFQAFKNIQQSSLSLPTPLNNVIDITNGACEQIQKMLKAKGQTNFSFQTILPFLKISIEKYIFDRTQTFLKAMYLYRDNQITEKFNQKRKKIREEMTKQQIFEQVLLNKNLRAAEATSKIDSSVRGGIQFCISSCSQLQKVSLTSSPRQKIKYCQLMYAQLKSFFYEKLKMKYQLSSMEDIIPVFIIVILYTQVQNLRSELNIMIDYIQASNEDFQSEKRMVVNLSESYNYIFRDWKVRI